MKYKNLLKLAFLSYLLLPAISLAQEFTPLVGIPGVDANADFSDYINALYILSISIAALLAVIKIIIAGVKWMLSDVVSSKQQAKSDIQGALLGLIIVISAVLVLNIINPQITNTALFTAPVYEPNEEASGNTNGSAIATNTSNMECELNTWETNLGYNCAAKVSECESEPTNGTASAVKTNSSGKPYITCSIKVVPQTAYECTPAVIVNGNVMTEADCSGAMAECTSDNGYPSMGANANEISCSAFPPAPVETLGGASQQ